MKTFLVLILALIGLSGCASMGRGMQAMGQSMQQSSQNNRTYNCTTTNYVPNNYYSQCREQ